MERVIGIMGGTGVYEIDDLENPTWENVETPWGDPSDEILTGTLDGVKMCFLPRHGRGHVHAPSTVPYRANIDALKRLGVTDLFSVSAVGSLREHLHPGEFVIVDQFIDRTMGRPSSFFGDGCVAHVSLAHPTCPGLGEVAKAAGEAVGVRMHQGGTYVCIEGPQFAPLAESRLYRETFGADVIGMTNLPEARLAREAELCYCSVAMVTDYDSWHPDHGEVDITAILKTVAENSEHSKALVRKLPGLLGATHPPCPYGCDRSLEYAIVTSPDKRDPTLMAKLDAVAGRVLGTAA